MRPRVERPVIRGLLGDKEPLTLEFPDGRAIDVQGDAFAAAMADARVVAVEFELGTFLIIGERRARGGQYWVARAYHDGSRASFYLGREFGEGELRRAASALKTRLEASATPQGGSAVDDVVRDLLQREHDPDRRAAAEAIAAMVRGRHKSTPPN